MTKGAPGQTRVRVKKLIPGAVVVADFGAGARYEQQSLRPAVVISSLEYLELFSGLVAVMPATTKNRGWPSHVELRGKTGLTRPTYALTEQFKVISSMRVRRVSGVIDSPTQRRLSEWLTLWQEL